VGWFLIQFAFQTAFGGGGGGGIFDLLVVCEAGGLWLWV
jgi:hypothetical protein